MAVTENLNDLMLRKLRTHYAMPTRELSDLLKLWRADQAVTWNWQTKYTGPGEMSDRARAYWTAYV